MAQVSGGSSLESGIQNMLGSMPSADTMAKGQEQGFKAFQMQEAMKQSQQQTQDRTIAAKAFRQFDSTTTDGQANIIKMIAGSGNPEEAIKLQANFAKQNAFTQQLKFSIAKLEPFQVTNHIAAAKSQIDAATSILDYSKTLDGKGITGVTKSGMMTSYQNKIIQQEVANGTITADQAKSIPQWNDQTSVTYFGGQIASTKKVITQLEDHMATLNSILHPGVQERNKIAAQSLAEKTRHDKAQEGYLGSNKPPSTESDNQAIAASFGLSPDAFKAAAEQFATTGKLPPGMSRSPKYIRLISALQNEAAILHPGENLAKNAATYNTNLAAMKNITTKVANIDRLSNAVENLYPRITALTAKINTRYAGEFGNQTINQFISKYGNNSDVQELKTLAFAAGRQYVELTTMPGSNAQMHTGASELAQELLNGNMPMNKLAGGIKAMKEDAAAVKKGAEEEQKALEDGMTPPNNSSSESNKGTTSSPPKINTEAEYNKLPSGSVFIDPNGDARTKP